MLGACAQRTVCDCVGIFLVHAADFQIGRTQSTPLFESLCLEQESLPHSSCRLIGRIRFGGYVKQAVLGLPGVSAWVAPWENPFEVRKAGLFRI